MLKHSTTILLFIFGFLFISCSNSPEAEYCSLEDQNMRILNVFERNYLFNDEMTIPADYQALSADELVEQLKVTSKEDFSFWIEDAYAHEQSFNQGISNELFGFRPLFKLSETELASDDELKLYTVEKNSPAYIAGLRRGDTILSVDDISSEEIFTQIRSMNEEDEFAYYVQLFGLDHKKDELTLVWQSSANDEVLTQTIRRASYTTDVIESAKVVENGDVTTGYLAYRSFTEFSSEGLVESFETFDEQGVDNIIFDFRTNGGGLVSLAGFIANSTINKGNELSGEPLLNFEFNEQRSFNNETYSIVDDSFEIGARNVAVLIDRHSCSASELVINMLKPYANVTIIGDENSCGKPYGMEGTPICQGLLYPVSLLITNAQNEADYLAGFTPDCVIENTLAYNWGDERDPQIDEALHILNGGSCRTIPESISSLQEKSAVKKLRLKSESTFEDYENPNAPLFSY